MNPERWLPVSGYEGLYEVSNHGRVRSLDRMIIRSDGRKPYLRRGMLLADRRSKSRNCFGRNSVVLCDGISQKQFVVAALVLSAFLCRRPSGFDACHSDGNRENDHASNLYWGRHVENMADRDFHGTTIRGEKAKHAILTEEIVIIVRNSTATTSSLARKYGVANTTIHSARTRKNWKHLND